MQRKGELDALRAGDDDSIRLRTTGKREHRFEDALICGDEMGLGYDCHH
jgi:hypothetical protein